MINRKSSGSTGEAAKPAFTGGTKTTVKNPNSFSVVGNSVKQGGEAGEVAGQQAAVYRIQVCATQIILSSISCATQINLIFIFFATQINLSFW